MKAVGPIVALGVGRRTLLAGLALIIVGFGLASMAAFWKERTLQSTKNVLIRTDHLSRLVHDLDRKRLLIDSHIFERDTEDMAQLELQLATVDADLSGAVQAYGSLPMFPAEADVWRPLEAELRRIDQPIRRALALSRQNVDVQARAEILLLDRDFDAIDRLAEGLIRINRESTGSTVKTIESLQRRSMLLLESLLFAGGLAVLLTSVWMIRAMNRRDALIRREATELESRNRELDAFAGRIAHDLRGPLTTITLSAERLAHRAPNAEGASDVLERGVSRMEALVRDLLALSRVDAQLAGLVSRMEVVVETAATELSPQVKDVDGSLRVEVEPASVRCSEGLLREALMNLGENAVKYRRPGTPLVLEIRGRESGRLYELAISDNGVGMSPVVVRRAFEPFFRGDAAQSLPGTGLGLSIVKRIVDASGGTIAIESEVGRGTAFLIRLPLAIGR
jgi:signal transduction histidine kinase